MFIGNTAAPGGTMGNRIRINGHDYDQAPANETASLVAAQLTEQYAAGRPLAPPITPAKPKKRNAYTRFLEWSWKESDRRAAERGLR